MENLHTADMKILLTFLRITQVYLNSIIQQSFSVGIAIACFSRIKNQY